MNSILGRTILGYNVIEKIGTGGFGEVYRVERNNIVGNVTRALKVVTLPKENQYMEVLNSMGGDYEKADNYFRQELNRVVNEIRVFAMISEKDNHNIVSYYENDIEKVGKYKYNIYILMEMLTPLDQWLTTHNMTVEEGIDIGLSIANALKICHENKIMHRDIKLNNIFVSKDGKFKLGDFGVSKRFDTLTRANTIKGTPRYIAPEIYLGNEKYNNSVDIYSLGILLYYLFNKRRFPFYPDFPAEYNQEDEDKAFYKRMKYEEVKPPICAPEPVAKVILKAISRPKERYQTAQQFIDELTQVKASLGLTEQKAKIGFEPKKIQESELSTKEEALAEQLENNHVESISFGEHSVKTLRETKTGTDRGKKLWIAVVALVLVAGTGIGALYFQKGRTVTTGQEQTVMNATTQEVLTIREETTAETTTEQPTVQIITIGNYQNKKYEKVKQKLKHLKVKKKMQYSDKVKKGYVIAQSIASGTKVVAGTKIILTISKGSVPVTEPEATTKVAEVYTKASGGTGGNTQKGNSAGQGGGDEFQFGEIIE